METFLTPNGKKIEAFHEGHSLKVKFTTGGLLPECLRGTWTSFIQLKTSVEMYLDTLKKKTKEIS